MNKETFIAIFGAHGIDVEWSELKWEALTPVTKETITEDEVKEAAKGWQSYAEEGGL